MKKSKEKLHVDNDSSSSSSSSGFFAPKNVLLLKYTVEDRLKCSWTKQFQRKIIQDNEKKEIELKFVGEKYSLEQSLASKRVFDRFFSGGYEKSTYCLRGLELKDDNDVIQSQQDRPRIESYLKDFDSLIDPNVMTNDDEKEFIEKYHGINTSFFYLDLDGSATSLRNEDGDMMSINLNYGPGNKCWLAMDYESSMILNKFYKENIVLSSKRDVCNRNLHLFHEPGVMVDEKILKRLKIKYTYVLQQPGDLIFFNCQVLHAVINDGPCIAEAKNIVTPSSYRIPENELTICDCPSQDDFRINQVQLNRGVDTRYYQLNARKIRRREKIRKDIFVDRNFNKKRCSKPDCDLYYYRKSYLNWHDSLMHKPVKKQRRTTRDCSHCGGSHSIKNFSRDVDRCKRKMAPSRMKIVSNINVDVGNEQKMMLYCSVCNLKFKNECAIVIHLRSKMHNYRYQKKYMPKEEEQQQQHKRQKSIKIDCSSDVDEDVKVIN